MSDKQQEIEKQAFKFVADVYGRDLELLDAEEVSMRLREIANNMDNRYNMNTKKGE